MNNQSFSINIISSLQKRLLIVIPHLLITMLLIWLFQLSEIPFGLLLLLFIGVVLSGIYYYRLHNSQMAKTSVTRITHDANKTWKISSVAKQSKQAKLCSSSYSSNMLIIMNFVTETNDKYTVLITPDCVASEDFRKLKLAMNVEKFNQN